ncbi:hypothetical protein Rsub_11999 [Raphidocelis subcapitata]|uniref:AB hydrolase-1 domain-containing protein n=1 Tax=Raphidocelis subcapitata TaxID=307507 RepID=A0A2V0PGX3_9CHLO|nr:hypothetical protein Rsub_11999 [Raphidocelis subcapitata]|eukprot:GBF99054.1 hypothetical protein Rsub_11999 [Raphidocelis subcapitata]
MRPKHTYIRFTLDDELPQQAPWARPRPGCGQRCQRCLRFTGFCLVCTGTLFQAVAPWVISVFEALSVALMALLLAPHPPGPPALSFDFRYDLGDVVIASALRAAVISGTYAYGTRRQYLRPYLYTAYALGGAGLAYALIKAFYFVYVPRAWLAQAGVLAVFGTFSWVHVLAARDVVAWARRRAAMGLATFPWEPGLRERLLPQRAGAPAGGSDGASSGAGRGDVPPEHLADPDSNFTPVGDLWVHWKEALPPLKDGGAAAPQGQGNGHGQQGQRQGEGQRRGDWASGFAAASGAGGGGGGGGGGESAAVLLIHSGGGGAFAWRNVMADLAARAGVRVVAFDRPGFGLTSRPAPPPPGSGRPNPYAPAEQARLALQLAAALGIRRAVLVAHGDGCVVATMAAALALRQRGLAPSASSADGRSAPRARSASIASPPRAEGSLETGGASSVGSSEALSRAAAAASAAAAAAGGASRGPASAAGSTADATCGSGPGSEAASLTASLSFQSLLASADSGDAAHAHHHAHGAQQQAAWPAASRAPPRGAAWRPDLEAGGAAEGPPPHGVAPELQAMSPAASDAAHAGSLAPQLWPFAAPQPGPGPGGPPPRAGQQRVARAASDADAAGSEDCTPRSRDLADGACDLEVAGVALLHPKLSPGATVGGLARLLARARLGRSVLRPLLRAEVGEVANRRAWHRGERCTKQVLELYRRPLRVEGWDTALLAASVASEGLSRRATGRDLAALRALPALVATGSHDRLCSPVDAGRVAATAGARIGMVPGCGHLSHEEAPGALLQLLAPFVAGALGEGGGGGGPAGGAGEAPNADGGGGGSGGGDDGGVDSGGGGGG